MNGSILLSPEAQRLSIDVAETMSDDEALLSLSRMRWPASEGKPVCPHCGSLQSYSIKRPNGFRYRRCGAVKCRKDYSIFSGTLFGNPKKSPNFYVRAIALFIHSRGQINISEMGRVLGINYRTAWALANNFRKDMSRGYEEAGYLALVAQKTLDATAVNCGKVDKLKTHHA